MSKHRAADTTLTLMPLAERLAQLAAESARADPADPRLGAVHQQITQLADAVAEVIAAIADERREAAGRHDQLLAAIERQSGRTGDVLEAGVRRLESSSDALAAYLDGRDAAIEGERDRVLRDVLDDFAASLHARERRSVARRLIEAVDRRRDARDAARWRREHGAEQRPVRRTPERAGGDGEVPRVIDLDAAARLRRPAQRR